MTFFPEWLTGSHGLRTDNFLHKWIYLAVSWPCIALSWPAESVRPAWVTNLQLMNGQYRRVRAVGRGSTQFRRSMGCYPSGHHGRLTLPD